MRLVRIVFFGETVVLPGGTVTLLLPHVIDLLVRFHVLHSQIPFALFCRLILSGGGGAFPPFILKCFPRTDLQPTHHRQIALGRLRLGFLLPGQCSSHHAVVGHRCQRIHKLLLWLYWHALGRLCTTLRGGMVFETGLEVGGLRLGGV